MTNAYESSTEGTRTEAMSRALFLASRKHNDGITVTDALLYGALPDYQKHHLLDVAAAAEHLMTEFPDESGPLLIVNVAWCLWDAYHLHEYCDEPHLPYQNAPKDIRDLWYKYAEKVVDAYMIAKYNPTSEHYKQIKVRMKA